MALLTSLVGVLAVVAACGREPAAAGAVAVEPADLPAPPTDLGPGERADGLDETADQASADAETPSDSRGRVGSSAGGGGLQVLAGDGALVGLLVARGHPHQGGSTSPAGNGSDLLRDGVLVYNPDAGLFFGVAMASGKVIAPRLGIASSDCLQPNVAGYYADGPEISGYDYAFVWKGKWWRIRGGEKLALVGCAGVGTGGEAPTCVPHSGSCRGFPVEAASPSLPTAFVAPLRFVWAGGGR